jgi:hypothetical protein
MIYIMFIYILYIVNNFKFLNVFPNLYKILHLFSFTKPSKYEKKNLNIKLI